jgi:hypothetical protein
MHLIVGRLGHSDDHAWLGFSAVRILGSTPLAASGATDGFLVAEMVAEGLGAGCGRPEVLELD